MKRLTLAALAVLVIAALGCVQNQNVENKDSQSKPNSAKNIVVRTSQDGTAEFAEVNSALPERSANPEAELLQSLNWQPLKDTSAIEGSHAVNTSDVSNNSYYFISNPQSFFEKQNASLKDESSSYYYYGYVYPYNNYYYSYYPTYGYTNWYWPGYTANYSWAYNYYYWPTYYTTSNWWYYQPYYPYYYGGYNYYWYARWW